MPKDQPIPPEGIGHRIKHLSYSDIGGRPDSVQIMSNRKHLYVGHMFGDGVTILDASDPRRLKPVSFFTAGQYTRTHHLQSSDDLLLVANGANIVAMQSYSDQRGYFENSLAESITKRKNFRSGLSIHDISKPGEMREIAFSGNAGAWRQPLVLDGRALCLCFARTSMALPIIACLSSTSRKSLNQSSCRSGGCRA